MCRDGSLVPQEVLDRLAPEAQAIVRMLLAEIERLRARVVELEARLGQTPQNSSRPPSSQHPHARPPARRNKSGRRPGAQPGHPRHERSLIPAEECHQVHVLRPECCRRCGEALTGRDADPLRHQVWELPEIRPVVTEYRRHRLTCPGCGTRTTAPLPAGVPGGQSGPRLVAFTALLMAYFRQSKRRAALFLESALNVPCSAGLTVKHQQLAAAALRPCYERLRSALPQCEAVHLDETATKESGRNAWLWTAVTADFTVFTIRPTRSADVVRDLLGPSFGGVVTSDRYAAYDGCPRRQLCWAHLLRDFQAMIDAGGAARRVGRRLRDTGRELIRRWHRYRDGTITRQTLRRGLLELKYRVCEALEQGMRCRHAPTAATCAHIFDRFDHLWTFLDHPHVGPTNNAAERALRHAVIWRKLSFGTQSQAGSRFVETMLSVIETCRQQGRRLLSFVTGAVQAHFHGQPTPPLLPDA